MVSKRDNLTEIVRFRAPQGLSEAIAQVAAKESISASALMRRALIEKLKASEGGSGISLYSPASGGIRLAAVLSRAAEEAR